MKTILILLIITTSLTKSYAVKNLPDKVSQVTIRDSYNDEMQIPMLGEKHLLIFYPDPDSYSQNKHFTDFMEEEENHVKSDKIFAFGIVNLKDAPLFPDYLVRLISRQKIKKTGANIYFDPDNSLPKAWGLGDLNNTFTIIFITKDREIAFFRDGVMSDDDIKRFFEVIKKYK